MIECFVDLLIEGVEARCLVSRVCFCRHSSDGFPSALHCAAGLVRCFIFFLFLTLPRSIFDLCHFFLTAWALV